MKRLPYTTWIIMVSLTVFKLWLTAGQPVRAITYAVYDDAYFLKIAQHLINGKWLGAYDFLTLIKGPFYPAFIAGTFWLGIPLLLAQHLFYSAACLIFTLAVLPLLKRPLYALLLYTLLLFNPVTYDAVALRVVREYVYTSLMLLSLGGAIGLAVRWREPWRKTWPWALGMGLSLGAFWITREEGIWLLPALGWILAGSIFLLWRAGWADWRAKAGLWLGGLAIPVMLTLFVSSLNWANYGLFAKTEYDAPAFKTAYGSLTRVKVGKPVLFVPVTRKMRKNIYDVSPAFRELRPYLEGEMSEGWMDLSVKLLGYRGEIHGGMFMWAFRDAVAHAGYYSGGKFPAEYYQRLAAEIERACDQHWLDCYPPRSSMAPPWRMDYLRPLAKNLIASSLFVARFEQLSFECALSAGSEADSWIFRDLTHNELCGWNQQTRLSGQVESEAGPVAVRVRGSRGDRLMALISQTSEFSKNSEASPKVHFSIEVRCPFGCQLEVGAQDDPSATVFNFEELPARQSIERGPFHLSIEENSASPLAVEQAQLDERRQKLMQVILRVYRLIHAPLLLLALIATLYLGIRLLKRRSGLELWLAASVLWVALALRILVIGMIHTTSFAAISANYLMPAHPLMIALICLLLPGVLDAADKNDRKSTLIQ